jgi:hypothetical protein
MGLLANSRELGLSYMGGIYNKYQEDGLVLEKKRRVNVFAGSLPISD